MAESGENQPATYRNSHSGRRHRVDKMLTVLG